MLELIDLRKLKWDSTEDTNGSTQGTFPKSVVPTPEGKIYYKLSRCDTYLNEITGYESIFEVIVSRLCQVLGLNVLKYELVYGLINLPEKTESIKTYLCVSKDFRGNATKVTAEQLYLRLRENNEDSLTTLRRLGFSNYIDQILLIDYIIYNRDRHGKNIEFSMKDGKIIPAPIFDSGFSFVSPYGTNIELIKAFNANSDMPVNNFIGSNSLEKNLGLIQKPVIVNKLTKQTRQIIFKNTSQCLPRAVRDKVWEIIESRYNYAKDRKVLNERQ